MDVASKIHTKKLPAVALRGLTGINLWHAIIFIRGMGGKFYKDYPNDMHPTIDTPEFIKGVQVFGEDTSCLIFEAETGISARIFILASEALFPLQGWTPVRLS